MSNKAPIVPPHVIYVWKSIHLNSNIVSNRLKSVYQDPITFQEASSHQSETIRRHYYAKLLRLDKTISPHVSFVNHTDFVGSRIAKDIKVMINITKGKYGFF